MKFPLPASTGAKAMARLRNYIPSRTGVGKGIISARRSLRLRLVLFFAAFMLLAWGVATFFAWQASRKYIDEFFDTRQMLFAKTLLAVDIDPRWRQLPETKAVLRSEKKKARGEQEDDALAFAVFSGNGELLFTDGEEGEQFTFENGARGFFNTRFHGSDDTWRMVRLVSPDGSRVVAVGQELEYREDMALDMLSEQIVPWAVLLPVLLAGLLWMISRELAPLNEVAKQLEKRLPDDTNPLETENIPSEAQPLITALNSLFARICVMFERERAFISDAAHELRTPLTGLRIQAEVVELSADDAEARSHAVSKLVNGIDRCAHLVEQLLTLSRLEAAGSPPGHAEYGEKGEKGTEWSVLLREAVEAFMPEAEKKGVHLKFSPRETSSSVCESVPFSKILLRNLLDNAVKYTPSAGTIAVVLEGEVLTIRNSGPGVAEEYLSRLGERFFRPPGQEAPGSGLGLSIARQAAERCGLELSFDNIRDGGKVNGFEVRLSFVSPKRDL